MYPKTIIRDDAQMNVTVAEADELAPCESVAVTVTVMDPSLSLVTVCDGDQESDTESPSGSEALALNEAEDPLMTCEGPEMLTEGD